VLGVMPSLGYIYSDNSSALGYGRIRGLRATVARPSGVYTAKF